MIKRLIDLFNREVSIILKLSLNNVDKAFNLTFRPYSGLWRRRSLLIRLLRLRRHIPLLNRCFSVLPRRLWVLPTGVVTSLKLLIVYIPHL